MVCSRQQVAEQDARWLGYKEKATPDARYLDDLDANAGKKNYQRFQPICQAGNGDQWCQYYIAATTIDACGGSLEDARTVLRMPAGAEITGYTPTARKYYVQAGQYFTNPEIGDQVFFFVSAKGRVGHTGRVKRIDRTKMTFVSVEGNTSSDMYDDNGGCVAEHEYSYAQVGGTNRVNGFGRPAYASDALVIDEATNKPVSSDNMPCKVKDPEAFVRQAYVSCLGRIPEADGIKTWTEALIGGMDPTDVLSGIASSTEGLERMLGRAYVELLQRYPKYHEIEDWKRALAASGKGVDTVLGKIIKSDEYIALHSRMTGES